MRTMARSLAAHYAPIVLIVLALSFGSAALIFALRIDRPEHPPGFVPRSQVEICALLGAIMGDSDTPNGLMADAHQLYDEDGCAAMPPLSVTSTP